MLKLTGADFHTSEQHKDTTASRISRDNKDIFSLLEYLEDRNPFTETTSLRSIASGVTACLESNIDNAAEVGSRILEKMDDQEVNKHVFKRKDHAIQINAKGKQTLQGKELDIDPNLLFQRLTLIMQWIDNDPANMFKYEQCGYPASLFVCSKLLRPAEKPPLSDKLWKLVNQISNFSLTSHV